MAQNDLVTKFPYGVSSRGMPVVGGGGRETTGSVYFVGSTVAGASNNAATHGTSAVTPFLTIEYAFSVCSANKGDIIYVMPGHVETVNTDGGLNCDVAGVSVIGLGNGDGRAKIVVTGDSAAAVIVSQTDILLENLYFDIAYSTLTGALDIQNARCSIVNCDFLLADGEECEYAIVTDTNADNLRVLYCTFRTAQGVDSTNQAISLSSIDRPEIGWCVFEMPSTPACIQAVAAASVTLASIHHNYFYIADGITVVSFSSATLVTGSFFNNRIASDSSGVSILAADACALIDNWWGDTDNASRYSEPIPSPFGGGGIAGTATLEQLGLGSALNSYRSWLATVTADFTSATWNTVATHELLTVTGTVRIRLLAVCTGTLTSGGAGQIQLGHESDTDLYIAATDESAITTGDLWNSTTNTAENPLSTAIFDRVVNGLDIGYEITGGAMTGGTIVFYCWWEPLTSGATVAAGAGGAL